MPGHHALGRPRGRCRLVRVAVDGELLPVEVERPPLVRLSPAPHEVDVFLDDDSLGEEWPSKAYEFRYEVIELVLGYGRLCARGEGGPLHRLHPVLHHEPPERGVHLLGAYLGSLVGEKPW